MTKVSFTDLNGVTHNVCPRCQKELEWTIPDIGIHCKNRGCLIVTIRDGKTWYVCLPIYDFITKKYLELHWEKNRCRIDCTLQPPENKATWSEYLPLLPFDLDTSKLQLYLVMS